MVRRRPAFVSDNVRRKPAFVLRRAVHHWAPRQVSRACDAQSAAVLSAGAEWVVRNVEPGCRNHSRNLGRTFGSTATGPLFWAGAGGHCVLSSSLSAVSRTRWATASAKL